MLDDSKLLPAKGLAEQKQLDKVICDINSTSTGCRIAYKIVLREKVKEALISKGYKVEEISEEESRIYDYYRTWVSW